ncbi:MAG: FecR domain-containing protein [Rikenellaceae bacterium]|nr:FecR domain-containing protein [Rikenellaceae bacterium]MCL2691898.1 FecR domain-containing protein [Rikenellaceae bacterium]
MERNDVPDRLVRTIKDCLLGIANDSQFEELEQWLAADKANRRFYERMKMPSGISESMKKYLDFDSSEDIRQLRSKIRRKYRKSIFGRMIRYAGIAAVIILAVLGGRIIIDSSDKHVIPIIGKISETAVLTMPDGSMIALDKSTENSRVATRENVDIVHTENSLICTPQSDNVASASGEISFSSLNVPRGMTFNITLEDGTHVWLNADSRLRFPVAFGDSQRRVILEGEGYFEVAPDAKRPFIVETANQKVTVLGTQFNISAYPNETRQTTTLIEGSISLSVSGSAEQFVLKPGQQAVFSCKTGGVVVKEGYTEEVSSWREGIFLFDGDTLGEVFVKLSRWYDFDYYINDGLEGKIIRGNARIPDDVNSIFSIIEMVARVEITQKSGIIHIDTKE